MAVKIERFSSLKHLRKFGDNMFWLELIFGLYKIREMSETYTTSLNHVLDLIASSSVSSQL